ncbi:Fcf1-domain-containing protein [Xylogone sp. PMI_703]|nr:Fcf1-domain-containing protein [Xylogone sp. PMI_703]
MRGKRSKQYRKLMQQYGMSFGFREPYQVLLDADIIRDAERFKMDLVGGLERTLHGQVKPMITQCSMRHLYAASSEPGVPAVIDKAKQYERRRCGHRPETHPEPLSALECLSSVVDPKNNKTNKNRYIVASQQQEVRKFMRGVAGVPLVYVHRSVMIMEPMAESTADIREKGEKVKFREGLKRGSGSIGMKRKREEEGESDGEGEGTGEGNAEEKEEKKKKKKKKYGLKGPNPLSVKKSKKNPDSDTVTKEQKSKVDGKAARDGNQTNDSESGSKRKRRRKHGASKNADNAEGEAPTSETGSTQADASLQNE